MGGRDDRKTSGAALDARQHRRDLGQVGACIDRLAERAAFFNKVGDESMHITVPAGSHWVMGAGAPRIELIGLAGPLTPPESFAILLVFERAGKISSNVRIETASSTRQWIAN